MKLQFIELKTVKMYLYWLQPTTTFMKWKKLFKEIDFLRSYDNWNSMASIIVYVIFEFPVCVYLVVRA